MRSLIYQNVTRFKKSDRIFAQGIRLLIALPAMAWASLATASQTKVIINLSEQRA
jgi:hypothetical protein